VVDVGILIPIPPVSPVAIQNQPLRGLGIFDIHIFEHDSNDVIRELLENIGNEMFNIIPIVKNVLIHKIYGYKYYDYPVKDLLSVWPVRRFH
jgi:hypothetical protein